jgi:hypothetical protein
MANVFAPFGFSQYRGVGSAPTYEQVVGFCAYDTAAMYFGDPIFQNANGTVYPTTPGTGILAGVFAGCKYLSVSQKRTVWSNYWGAADVASGNTVEVYYINDPNARFLVQAGGSTTVGFAATDIGANVQFAYGTPNAMSGLSGAFINFAVSPTTTATLPFKVVGLVTNPPGANGTEAGAYNYGIVAFNNVSTKTLTGI